MSASLSSNVETNIGGVKRKTKDDGGTGSVVFVINNRSSGFRVGRREIEPTEVKEDRPLEAVGGVIDSLRERFTLDLSGLTPGEHLLVVRMADSAGNTGVAKVVLK